jgi:hypothetical protein
MSTSGRHPASRQRSMGASVVAHNGLADPPRQLNSSRQLRTRAYRSCLAGKTRLTESFRFNTRRPPADPVTVQRPTLELERRGILANPGSAPARSLRILAH